MEEKPAPSPLKPPSSFPSLFLQTLLRIVLSPFIAVFYTSDTTPDEFSFSWDRLAHCFRHITEIPRLPALCLYNVPPPHKTFPVTILGFGDKSRIIIVLKLTPPEFYFGNLLLNYRHGYSLILTYPVRTSFRRMIYCLLMLSELVYWS